MTRGPLVPIGPLVTCDDDFAAGRIQARDVFLRDFGPCRAARAFAFDDFHAAVEAAGDDVPVMQKGVFLEADVHERGFQAVFEVADVAFEDAADEALLGRALDVELLELAVFQHGRRAFRASPR